MTGLGNRRYLANFARDLLPGEGVGRSLSIILLDIDFFKAYNDFYGHGRGDDCIKTVADVIGRTVGPFNGTSIRYGGEEFLVLFPDTDKATATACAEAVRLAIEDLSIEHGSSDVSPFVTVSLGVAAGAVTAETFQLLIASADAALYAAKAGGRNRVTGLDGDAARNAEPRQAISTQQGKRVLH
jgi:diguanylate cyclase (GGDEF)-like protein